MIEHSDNLARFIRNDRVCFGIVERGNCEATFVFGINREIDFA